LEAFSDGVIAIIITIMVLELKAPKDPSYDGFIKVLPVFLSYTLSFLIVAVYWVNHHHLIHLVQKVDGCMLWSNMNLLFWMSLIPWATDCLGTNHAAPQMVRLYVLDAIACAVSFYILRHSIARTQKQDAGLVELHRKLSTKNIVSIAIYLTSLMVSFVSAYGAIAIMIIPAMMYFVPDRAVEKRVQD
jgi:uncharacterized membrane protein